MKFAKLICFINLAIFYIALASCNNEVDGHNEIQDEDEAEKIAEQIKQDLKQSIIMDMDDDKDGSVSFQELKNYLAILHEKNMNYNVDRQWIVYSPQIHEVFSWEGYEPEKREVLTWDHYFNQTYPELVGLNIPGLPVVREQDTGRILNVKPEEVKKQEQINEKTPEELAQEDSAELKSLKMMAQRADVRWKLADDNGDTLLTRQEFKFLLHPDEGHEELQKLFVREATEDMDLNHDDKIDLDEFMKHLQVLASDQEKTDESWLTSQRDNFARYLDKNKDKTLDESEIKDWLVPAKSKKFEDEATRLLSIGDKNDDSKLSAIEILENYEHFVGLLPAEYWQRPEDTVQDDRLEQPPSDRDEL